MMTEKVLVTYASTHGSTQEVAEFIAASLTKQGISVDLQPARNVRTVEGYCAVVIGAPLYILRWHKDALRFLARHRQAISRGLPVAVFAGGPYEKDDAGDWQEVRSQLDRELAKFPWFSPVAVEIVGGKFDPARLRFPWNLIPALRQQPASDLRNWAAIQAWANTLIPLFPFDLQEVKS